MKFVQTLVLILASLSVAPRAGAQLPETAVAAGQIGDALRNARLKSAIVFDFAGPNYDLNMLGHDLAHNFGLALTTNNDVVHLVERSKVVEFCVQQGLSVDFARDPSIASWIGRKFQVDVVIIGQLKIDDKKLLIDVTAYRSKDAKMVGKASAGSPLTDDLRALMAKSIDDVHVHTVAKIAPPADRKGSTFPRCIYCPQAGYDKEALRKHLNGTVVLLATVRKDGTAQDIEVIKGLPYGLSDKAIEAVERWKFAPASDRDGKPVDFSQVIEITFDLNR